MTKKLKIWHISDTHNYHGLLIIPEGMDVVIHSGDFTQSYDVFKNEPEAKAFLHWFGNLDIPYKILIAGNHDAFVYKNSGEFKTLCIHYNIIYLENTFVIIENLKIYGSPLTPTFGKWYFMKDRSKLHDVWSHIPEDTDILVVHGPPKGVLDSSYRRDNNMEKCGCVSLQKHVLGRIKPKLCLFGHIHNNDDIINAGVLKLSMHDTLFSNGSVVTDGKFGSLSSNGNYLEI
jgi:Icc-related predicted phosphoesterase